MTVSPRRMSLRRSGILAAGLAAGLLISGCGDGDDAGEDSSSSSSGGEVGARGSDLTPGLLPEDAFGAGAVVQPLTEQQLQGGAAPVGGRASGATVSPPECETALETTQPDAQQYEDAAGQVAVSGTTATAQVLLTGGPDADLGAVDEQLARCSRIEIAVPGQAPAAVTLAALELPDLGDAAAGFTMTTVAAGPDGQPVTVPALLVVVVDGDRTLSMFSTDAGGGALDEAGFVSLVEDAVSTAADELG